MRLDRPDAPHSQPLAPEDWTMTISSEGNQHVAIVRRGGQPMCRLSLAVESLSEDEIRTALAEKTRAWIAEYLERPHSGESGFSDLA